jgi:hypothetical protein
METTIAGMKTTPVEKNKFIELLTGLMETIEEVCNGGKNTEGNYLLLMNDLKTLYNMKEQINNTQVYQAITRAAPAPRQTHLNLQQKLQSKAYFKCEKCETVTQTKNKQRHYASELCQITYQTKCSGVVVNLKQHKWYAIQQVLTSCFRNRKQREPEFAAGICFLEPEKTCVCCNEKKFSISPMVEAYNRIIDNNGKLTLDYTQKHNLPNECGDCCKTRLKKEENDIKLAKEEKRLKNKEIKLAREQKKLAKEEAKEHAELNEMASNDINQAVKAVIKKKRVIKKKPVRKLVIEEEEEELPTLQFPPHGTIEYDDKGIKVMWDENEERWVEEEEELPTAVLLRKIWIENYNKSLPQHKFYDSEFECEMSIAIGGIHDSEAMNYEFNNIQSNRIKQLLKIVPVELPALELD